MPERKLFLVRLQATKLLQLPKIDFTVDFTLEKYSFLKSFPFKPLITKTEAVA